MSALDVSEDGFLGRRLLVKQPKSGFRSGLDAVFLAAAVNARSGDVVLELGCGVGAASLCLLARQPVARAIGVEITPEYAQLARENAAQNGLPLEVVEADIAALLEALGPICVDHIFFNPPYFSVDAFTAPKGAAHATAHSGADDLLGHWIGVGARRLKPKGTMTMIHRAEALGEALEALNAHGFGAIEVIPLWSRSGRAAKRVILRAIKGAGGEMKLSAGLVIHAAAHHGRQNGGQGGAGQKDLTTAAKLILEKGVGLDEAIGTTLD